MPDPTTSKQPPPKDPALEQGDIGDTVLHCDRNDVEVVNDLEEPNSIEMESEVEDDQIGGLVFTAMVEEPGGAKFCISDGVTDEEDDTAVA